MADSKKKINEKNASFGVSMPHEELRALDEKAEMSGCSRSMYLRHCAKGNVTIIDTNDLHWSIGRLRAMHGEHDGHLDQFYELARQALEQGCDGNSAILEKILDECGKLESLKTSMRTMEAKIVEILESMRDAVESSKSINR